mgnify:CR=1 FL=1
MRILLARLVHLGEGEHVGDDAGRLARRVDDLVLVLLLAHDELAFFGDLVLEPGEKPQEQGNLAREIIVKRRLGDLAFLGDLVHRSVFIALLGKKGFTAVQNEITHHVFFTFSQFILPQVNLFYSVDD